MSTPAITPSEPVASQTTDTCPATSRIADQKKSDAQPFDSLLTKKQKPAKGGPETAEPPAEQKPVEVSPEPDTGLADAIIEGTSSDDDSEKGEDVVTVTLTCLPYVQQEQNPLPAKTAPAQEVSLVIGENLSDATTTDEGAGAPIPGSTGSLRWVVVTAKDSPSSQPPAKAASPLLEAALSEATALPEPAQALITESNEPPKQPQSLRAQLPPLPVESLVTTDQSASPTPELSAVLKPAGISIALQPSSMQNAQTKQPNFEKASVVPAASVLAAELPTNLAATTGDFKDSDPGANAFDGQRLFAETMVPAQSPNSAQAIQTPENFSSALEKTQHMQTVIHHVIDTASRMRSDGRANVEVQVPLRDGRNLTIQLRWNNGELTPTFKTDSAELREAIQQSWSQFTSSTGERGMKIATPVFESPRSGLGDLNQRQNREQQHQQPHNGHPEGFQLPAQLKPTARSAPQPIVSRTASRPTEGLALYA